MNTDETKNQLTMRIPWIYIAKPQPFFEINGCNGVEDRGNEENSMDLCKLSKSAIKIILGFMGSCSKLIIDKGCFIFQPIAITFVNRLLLCSTAITPRK